MQAEMINPFLEAATSVIEQVANVKPSKGQLSLKEMIFHQSYIWIQIGMKGNMSGEIVFGFPEPVALKMASVMMGGFELTEMNEIGQSAISELGNMISGNASSILYNKGFLVDITPPKIVKDASEVNISLSKALYVPLFMDGIGQMDMQVVFTY